jgi:hypothetical protein
MTSHTCIGEVSLKRALELLAEQGDPVKQSTLSRYVAKYADALEPKRRGKEIVIDFEMLATHRRENIRLDGAVVETPATQSAGTRSEEAAANIRAQRRLRELELGEREGLLILKRDAEDAAHAAFGAMRSALALALNDTAETLASLTGCEARLIRPHLRAFEKKGLDQFVRVLTDRELLGEQEQDKDPPPKH